MTSKTCRFPHLFHLIHGKHLRSSIILPSVRVIICAIREMSGTASALLPCARTTSLMGGNGWAEVYCAQPDERRWSLICCCWAYSWIALVGPSWVLSFATEHSANSFRGSCRQRTFIAPGNTHRTAIEKHCWTVSGADIYISAGVGTISTVPKRWCPQLVINPRSSFRNSTAAALPCETIFPLQYTSGLVRRCRPGRAHGCPRLTCGTFYRLRFPFFLFKRGFIHLSVQ